MIQTKLILKISIVMIFFFSSISCSQRIQTFKNDLNKHFKSNIVLVDSLKKENEDLFVLCETIGIKVKNINDCVSMPAPIYKIDYDKLASVKSKISDILVLDSNNFFMTGYYQNNLIGDYLLQRKGEEWKGTKYSDFNDPFNINSQSVTMFKKYDLTNKKFFYINYYPYLYVIAYLERGEMKIIRFMQVNETQLYESFDIWVKAMRIDKIDISNVDKKYY